MVFISICNLFIRRFQAARMAEMQKNATTTRTPATARPPAARVGAEQRTTIRTTTIQPARTIMTTQRATTRTTTLRTNPTTTRSGSFLHLAFFYSYNFVRNSMAFSMFFQQKNLARNDKISSTAYEVSAHLAFLFFSSFLPNKECKQC